VASWIWCCRLAQRRNGLLWKKCIGLRKRGDKNFGGTRGEERKWRKKVRLDGSTSDVLLITYARKGVEYYSVTELQTNSVEPEPEGSSPHSQQPANDPAPEPGESTLHPQNNLHKNHLSPSSHLRLGLSSGLFPSGFPADTLYMFLPSPTRATCTAHLTIFDLICLIISGDEYKLWSSPMRKFLHSPIAWSLLPLFGLWVFSPNNPSWSEALDHDT
jgi:hypothetical protein